MVPHSFHTTRWSLIIRAGAGASSQTRTALEELCRLYWYPLYAFVRTQGVAAADRPSEMPPAESATAHRPSAELPITSAAKATYISSIVMMTVSFLVVTAGVVLFGLAFLLREPGTQEFWGWMGGAFGCFVGGIGSFIGCWNSYRQIEGTPDLMSSPAWTWLDRLMLIYGLIGVVLLMAGVFSWSRSHSATGQSLCLLGGISLLQGLGFSAYRGMIRRASS